MTDSPIPLSLIYAKPEDAEWLEGVVQVLWDLSTTTRCAFSGPARTTNPTAAPRRSEARALDLQIDALSKDFGADWLDPFDPDNPAVEYLIRAAAAMLEREVIDAVA